MTSRQTISFAVRGDHIELHQLLKATGLADSGGAGKQMVEDGLVKVDGKPESRKSCKIRAGQQVTVAQVTIQCSVG